jgi:hypothetical protein
VFRVLGVIFSFDQVARRYGFSGKGEISIEARLWVGGTISSISIAP